MNLNGVEALQFEILHHFLNLIFLEVADTEGDIILLDEHFIAFEDMILPKELLEKWEGFEYLEHYCLLDLYDFSHGVGGGLGVVNIGEEALEAEDLSCQHGLLVDQTFIGELNDHASLLHEEEVFGDLGIIHNTLVGIKWIFLSDFLSNQMQDGIWNHGEKFSLLEDEVEIGLFPLGRREVEF